MPAEKKGNIVYVDLLELRNAKLGRKPDEGVPDGPNVRMNLTMDDVLEINQRIRRETAQNARDRQASEELAEHQYCN